MAKKIKKGRRVGGDQMGASALDGKQKSVALATAFVGMIIIDYCY